MPRYIDADAFTKTIFPIGMPNDGDYVINADCEYYRDDTKYCKQHLTGYCEFDNVVKDPFNYCCYGERKEK